METREISFFIKEIGPFQVNGVNLMVQRFFTTEGHYENQEGVNIGNSIMQNINRFDEQGHFLSVDKWIYKPLDSFYWWITNYDKIKIEVNK